MLLRGGGNGGGDDDADKAGSVCDESNFVVFDDVVDVVVVVDDVDVVVGVDDVDVIVPIEVFVVALYVFFEVFFFLFDIGVVFVVVEILFV